MDRRDLLAFELREAYAVLLRCLGDLDDAAFAWEPVDDAWRVSRGADGRWSHDYADEEPDPAPFTTIGWRLTHVAMCKVMYHEWAFGPRRLTWGTFETPHDVETSRDVLERGQGLLVSDLDGLGDRELNDEVLTNWGEPWPAWRIFSTMSQHDLQHGGEIGALRDLRRSEGRSRTPP